MINWIDIKKVYEELPFGHGKMIMAMYTMIPPLRIKEFETLRIYTKKYIKDEINYIDLDEKIMVLYDYKTVKSYGVITVSLPDPLIDILRRYYEWLDKKNGDKLFDVNNFAMWYTRQLKISTGLSLSSLVFRHSFLSWFNDQKPTLEERKKICRAMCNSISCQLGYVDYEFE
jgi:hypothetical protein